MSDKYEQGLPLSRTQRTIQREVMAATQRLREKNVALTMALTQYIVASSRMRDRWAEGDDAAKQKLWNDLHSCEQPARDLLTGRHPESATAGKE